MCLLGVLLSGKNILTVFYLCRFISASWNPLKKIYQLCCWALNILSAFHMLTIPRFLRYVILHLCVPVSCSKHPNWYCIWFVENNRCVWTTGIPWCRSCLSHTEVWIILQLLQTWWDFRCCETYDMTRGLSKSRIGNSLSLLKHFSYKLWPSIFNRCFIF